MKHQNGVTCERCSAKLLEACSEIAAFFYWVKANHPEAHISWTFRDQANQEQMFRSGKSKLHWPESKHNVMVDGRASSEAIDLFFLTDDGQAVWPRIWFDQIHKEVLEANLSIFWGGQWEKLGDFDHFQLVHESA